MSYIVIWKDEPGQQVSTVLDKDDQLAVRSAEYLNENGIFVVHDADAVFDILADADGTKFAVTSKLARNVLGWDFA